MQENKRGLDPASEPDEDIPDMAAPYWQAKLDAAPVVRGRPRVQNPKVSTTIRLDADVVDFFKSRGKGWQTRINQALRKVMEES